MRIKMINRVTVWAGLVVVLLGTGAASAAEAPAEKYVPSAEDLRAGYGRPAPMSSVYKAQLTPRWSKDGTRFWYRNELRGGTAEFVLVDAEHGTRGPAFDHAKLAASLGKALGREVAAAKLPFDNIEFTEDGKSVRFSIDGKTWSCDLGTYDCSTVKVSSLIGCEEPLVMADDEDSRRDLFASFAEPTTRPQAIVQQKNQGEDDDEIVDLRVLSRPVNSPDGRWTAFIKDSNAWLKPVENGEEFQLSTDGRDGYAYGRLQWSPDSKTVVGFRIEPGERKEVYLIESSPKEGGRAKMHARPYLLPGDKFTAYELNLFDVAARKQIRPELDRVDFGSPDLRWKPDGRRFTYEKVDRGHQRFRLIEVNATTGQARNLIDEKTQTFIWTVHGPGVYVNQLDKTDEVLYWSERDGWRHLYLIDARTGEVKNQITKGEWVVREVLQVDEGSRQIWFRACGRNAGEDPYFIHYYRVNFDGSGLVALTEGNGTHSVSFSPDRRFLIDTWSRVDQPPVHVLRRSSDGKQVCELETADASELYESGWKAPEVFVAKGRDGKTDIWGIICRPKNFDPAKRYPVIESIYAGPQDSFVPKAFPRRALFTSLANLGFIVVQIDGMGTANRSKAFHDVCWHDLKDAGFPDRILWMKAAAAKYPSMDLSRVGVYGTSAGGQNAAGAVLFHGDFYKAAVAACGCHDNRMDKASWNEQWMGYPVGPHYAESSNIENAKNLRGRLMLVLGELDDNVPIESTMRLVDALLKARKDFEFLVVPGMGHSNGGPMGVRRMQDFFVRNLHGIEPPDHNAESGT